MRLQELKKEYDACRLSKDSYSLLLKQREDIHDAIIQLKERAERALLKHKESRQEWDELTELKQKLRTIDHKLDELGEHQDEKLAELKEKLVASIQKSFPESAASYQQLCESLEEFRSEEKRCMVLRERLRPFYEALSEGAASKQSQGLLGVLFGRNAKVILARAIRKASIEAERVYKQINDERIQEFLSTFLDEANRPWNGSLYRERFYEMHKEFTDLMKQLELRKNQAKREAIKTEKQIEIWIEQHCKEC